MTVTVEQPSCCSTETGNSAAYSQVTTEDLSIPHLTVVKVQN